MPGPRKNTNAPSPLNKVATIIVGGLLVLAGVLIVLAKASKVTGVWSAFCILLGISFILIGNDERPVGLCFLVAALVFFGIGLVLFLR